MPSELDVETVGLAVVDSAFDSDDVVEPASVDPVADVDELAGPVAALDPAPDVDGVAGPAMFDPVPDVDELAGPVAALDPAAEVDEVAESVAELAPLRSGDDAVEPPWFVSAVGAVAPDVAIVGAVEGLTGVVGACTTVIGNVRGKGGWLLT